MPDVSSATRRQTCWFLRSLFRGEFAAAEEVVKAGAKCDVLTALDDVLTVSTALDAGVSGYILKGVSGLDLIKALKAIYAGQRCATPELAFRLLEVGSEKLVAPRRDSKRQSAFGRREQQLLEHITKGFTNEEIAAKFGLSQGTIKVLPVPTLQENAGQKPVASDYCRSQSGVLRRPSDEKSVISRHSDLSRTNGHPTALNNSSDCSSSAIVARG